MDKETLIKEAKAFINFTWKDEAKDKEIEGFVTSSIAYLQDVYGKEIDYDTNYLAKDLLLNRVLYMDSRALPDFQSNYAGYLKELAIMGGDYETESL